MAKSDSSASQRTDGDTETRHIHMPDSSEPQRSQKLPKPPKPRKVERRRKGRKG